MSIHTLQAPGVRTGDRLRTASELRVRLDAIERRGPASKRLTRGPCLVTILATLIGVTLIVIVLRDIFFNVFSFSGSGTVSSKVLAYVWRVARWATHHHPDRLGMVGPISLVLIILSWVLALVVGWACIFWPHLPDGFLLSPGMVPERNAGFLDAVYVSLVALATLGYGEIAPQATWLRILAPLEALLGFALLTASISWLLSVFPSVARRRHLAREVALLTRQAEQAGHSILTVRVEADSGLLLHLAQQVISVRDDFVQYRVIYYFRDADPASALEVALPSLLALARDAKGHERASISADGTLLLEAIADLTRYLGETWLDCRADASIEEVLQAYAADNLRPLDSMERRVQG